MTSMKVSMIQSRNVVTTALSMAINKPTGSKIEKRWLSPNGFSFKIVQPTSVEPLPRVIPGHILKPPYGDINFKSKLRPTWKEKVPKFASIRTENEINKIRKSCKLAAIVLKEASEMVKPGVTPQDIDDKVFDTCIKLDCYPSPLNYLGFPRSVTTSVNNVACHSIPDRRPLEEGDIISIDVSIYHNGFHGDTCGSYPVGSIDPDAQKLLFVSQKAVEESIKICKHGTCINDIGKTIEKFVSSFDLSVNPSLCGHGIGEYFHGPPDIIHVDIGQENNPERMVTGMVFTIEPCVIEGQNVDLLLMEDGWTLVSTNNSRSAQFEHTILINENGAEVLT